MNHDLCIYIRHAASFSKGKTILRIMTSDSLSNVIPLHATLSRNPHPRNITTRNPQGSPQPYTLEAEVSLVPNTPTARTGLDIKQVVAIFLIQR